MQFLKEGEIYKVIRITGSQDNFLGISFAENEILDLEVIELEIKPITITKPVFKVVNPPILITKAEIKREVLAGLDSINQSLGTNYRLSHIYFVPSDSCEDEVYRLLIAMLIRHYHNGKEFKERLNSFENYY
jgi:hypothetical protein